MAPVFAQMASGSRAARFVSVDVEASELNQQLAASSAVRAFPTFHFYRRGMRVDEFMGADTARLQRTLIMLQVRSRPLHVPSHNPRGGE